MWQRRERIWEDVAQIRYLMGQIEEQTDHFQNFREKGAFQLQAMSASEIWKTRCAQLVYMLNPTIPGSFEFHQATFTGP